MCGLKVEIEYLGHIRNVLGSRRDEEVEVKENASVADLLSALSSRHGPAFRKAIYEPQGEDVKPNYIVTVNGYLLNQLKGLETRLKNGDHVTILPIVSGG
jgi:MoaD family protein